MVLYIILFIVLLIIILLGVALIRAVLIKKECGDSKPYDMEKDGIDPKLHAEHLSRMIQVASVSRRGSNDLTKIYEMHKRLEEITLPIFIVTIIPQNLKKCKKIKAENPPFYHFL